jgi:peptidoglycan/xylan/chitin deacetylase (PgdA/CDA1 family)
MAREIQGGQNSLVALTGQRPCFFRPTAGLRNPFLEPILARHGLHLATWTRRGFDTRNRDAEEVVRRLTSHLAAGDILLLHDGNAARTDAGQPVILAALPRVLEAAAAIGLTPITLRSALDISTP